MGKGMGGATLGLLAHSPTKHQDIIFVQHSGSWTSKVHHPNVVIMNCTK
jgi:hypothetical protein